MEMKVMTDKLGQFLNKYKYVALVILIGVVLMLLPSRKEKTTLQTTATSQNSVLEDPIDEKLTEILRNTNGVGDVYVLLTKGEGEETIYQTDSDSTIGENDSNVHSSTVTVTDSQRGQSGLIRQINPARYLGAVVVCQGADDPQVRLQVVDAVSKATGLKSNCISVLKMK